MNSYSKLDRDKQSFSIAEQSKDHEYTQLFDRRMHQYDEEYGKMLSDRDQNRKQSITTTQNLQKIQMKEKSLMNSIEQDQRLDEETQLLFWDWQEKIKQDYERKKKKLDTQIMMTSENEKFKQIKARLDEESDRYLTEREFGLNKSLLREMAREDLKHSEQEKLLSPI